jgi:hypothetical protein
VIKLRVDFTLKKYDNLCKNIIQHNYTALTFYEWIVQKEKTNADKKIILRHDVDRFPNQAKKLAIVEYENNIKSSYYFRIPSSWNPKIIENIYSLGHEIGLHYECLDKAKGDVDMAAQFLEKDLNKIRQIAPVNTVSMHGNPLTKFDNRDIWKKYKLSDFSLHGEVYLSMDFEKVMYYSDTGRTWEENKFNMKDFIPKNKKFIISKPIIKTTNELISLVENDNKNLYLLIHPERWRGSFIGWLFSFISDFVINYIKVFIKLLRK